jgi:D-alanyl-D-alanine carboxypeptidase (penicillin-binding protein 5/6)
MDFAQATFFLASCLLTKTSLVGCFEVSTPPAPLVAIQAPRGPVRQSEALDVELTAKAVLVWDVASGQILYDKKAAEQRPIASLTKLLSALYIRQSLPLDQSVVIPPEVVKMQQKGADIALPVGEHALARDLLEAGMVASANDALVALALAVASSEDEFVKEATAYGRHIGLEHTVLANATGLSGGTQYSTAHDVRRLVTRAYADPVLASFLAKEGGVLTTLEGKRRAYKTTNKLLGTYLPIRAAKTGYTIEAGENLTLITEGPDGQQIGAVVLGSANRFQDMKTLVEWIWRTYTWKKTQP